MSCKSESNTSLLGYCRTEADIDPKGAKLKTFSIQNSNFKINHSSEGANVKYILTVT